jgi:hypothetical protein
MLGSMAHCVGCESGLEFLAKMQDNVETAAAEPEAVSFRPVGD